MICLPDSVRRFGFAQNIPAHHLSPNIIHREYLPEWRLGTKNILHDKKSGIPQHHIPVSMQRSSQSCSNLG
jgi:hypothetical protein